MDCSYKSPIPTIYRNSLKNFSSEELKYFYGKKVSSVEHGIYLFNLIRPKLVELTEQRNQTIIELIKLLEKNLTGLPTEWADSILNTFKRMILQERRYDYHFRQE